MRRVGQTRKRDANEPGIVTALERIGVKVQRISAKGFADLVCWHPRYGFRLVEVKGAKGRHTAAQTETQAGGWPIETVRTAEEAMALFTRRSDPDA